MHPVVVEKGYSLPEELTAPTGINPAGRVITTDPVAGILKQGRLAAVGLYRQRVSAQPTLLVTVIFVHCACAAIAHRNAPMHTSIPMIHGRSDLRIIDAIADYSLVSE